MASLRNHIQNDELYESGNEGKSGSMQCDSTYEVDLSKLFPCTVNCSSSPESTRSYSDRRLEIFNHRHGLLILHLLAALMFVPSLVAWLQVKLWLSPCWLLFLYSALALFPYMVFYPMAAIGVVSFAFRVMQRGNIKNG